MNDGFNRALAMAVISDTLDLLLPPRLLSEMLPFPFVPPHEIIGAVIDGGTEAIIEGITGKPSIFRELGQIPEQIVPKFPSHSVGVLLAIIEPGGLR
jgi:hypothetical protein